MLSARAEPVRNDVTNQFAALVIDREERVAVEVTIEGPAGRAMVMAEVDATYDLRPPPFMLAVYALPFLLAGFLGSGCGSRDGPPAEGPRSRTAVKAVCQILRAARD